MERRLCRHRPVIEAAVLPDRRVVAADRRDGPVLGRPNYIVAGGDLTSVTRPAGAGPPLWGAEKSSASTKTPRLKPIMPMTSRLWLGRGTGPGLGAAAESPSAPSGSAAAPWVGAGVTSPNSVPPGYRRAEVQGQDSPTRHRRPGEGRRLTDARVPGNRMGRGSEGRLKTGALQPFAGRVTAHDGSRTLGPARLRPPLRGGCSSDLREVA